MFTVSRFMVGNNVDQLSVNISTNKFTMKSYHEYT